MKGLNWHEPVSPCEASCNLPHRYALVKLLWFECGSCLAGALQSCTMATTAQVVRRLETNISQGVADDDSWTPIKGWSSRGKMIDAPRGNA